MIDYTDLLDNIEHAAECDLAPHPAKFELDAEGNIHSRDIGNDCTCYRASVVELVRKCEALQREAEAQAQEARTQRAIVQEIYEAVTEKTGEPGDWDGAAPVVELVERVRELERDQAIAREACNTPVDIDLAVWGDRCDNVPGDTVLVGRDELIRVLETFQQIRAALATNAPAEPRTWDEVNERAYESGQPFLDERAEERGMRMALEAMGKTLREETDFVRLLGEGELTLITGMTPDTIRAIAGKKQEP